MSEPNLIIPEVYSGIVREKFEGRLKVGKLSTHLGFLKNTTVGETVTFPKFKTIGDAEVVVKGTPIDTEDLEQDSSQATIKQIGKGVRVFDIDDITSFGNHVKEAADQQAIVFARRLDADLIAEAMTTPLKKAVAGAKAITANELNSGIEFFGDQADVEDMAGIVVHSLLTSSFLSMPEFVDSTKTFTADGSGIQRRGLIGYFRSIPVFVSDYKTYQDEECLSFVIKKNALAYMEKRGINIELDRQPKLKATDVVGDYIYATKLIDDSGVVMLRKTIVPPVG